MINGKVMNVIFAVMFAVVRSHRSSSIREEIKTIGTQLSSLECDFKLHLLLHVHF